jgi:hypothetical protein
MRDIANREPALIVLQGKHEGQMSYMGIGTGRRVPARRRALKFAA